MNAKTWKLGIAGVLFSALIAGQLRAQEQVEEEQPAQPTTVVQALRASNIIGMDVRNPADESLGEIEDLVVDTKKGQIQYAALSFGGFLGIGDKLFAVPWDILSLVEEEGEQFLVLDVEKKKLENAPGFNKEKWPDISDPQWRSEIDKFYGIKPQRQETEGQQEKAEEVPEEN